MMTVSLDSYSFWVIGAVWLTVPILSWLWSLASLYMYRKIARLMAETTSMLEQAKTLNDQMASYRQETLEMRTRAEEELRLACTYYSRISDLLKEGMERP
jgi:hypothetical protein